MLSRTLSASPEPSATDEQHNAEQEQHADDNIHNASDGNEHSEDDSEGSDDGSNDDDDEEEEPALKYERLGGQAAALFAKDSASALAFDQDKLVRTHH